MKRTGIGYDEPHTPSKAEALQVGPISIQVARAVAADDAMLDQERVEFAARRKTQMALQFRAGQMPQPEFVERKRFEGAPLHFFRRSVTGGQLVWDAEGQVHGLILQRNRRSAQGRTHDRWALCYIGVFAEILRSPSVL